MPARRITRMEEWSELGGVWNETLSRSPARNVFLTAEWLQTWWRNFGEGRRLVVLHARSGSTDAFAPLMIERSTLGGELLRFVGAPHADAGDFVVPTGAAEAGAALMEEMFSTDWRTADLREVPAEGSLLPVLLSRRLSSTVRGFRSGEACRCPYVPLEGTWQTFHGSLSKSMRKELRRGEARLAAAGEVSYERVARLTPVQLREIFDLYGRRHRGRSGRDMFADHRMRNFYTELADRMAHRGWLDVSLLRVDGRLVCYRFGFVYHGRVSAWNTAFDPEFAAAGPAQLLLARLLEDSFSRGYEEVDLLRGARDYKLRWTSRTRSNLFFSLFRRRSDFLATAAWLRLRSGLKRAEENSPILGRVWRSVSKRIPPA